MKTLLRWLNFRPLLLALLAVAAIVALISLGFRSELSKSDWGTWVGSIGTAATLAGTLVLATSETRRRERSEMILAHLHVAALLHRIQRAHDTVFMVKINLEASVKEGGVTPQEIHWAAQSIEEVRLWDIAELVPLAPLPGPIAPKLAQVIDQLTVVKELLKEAAIEFPSDEVAYHREVLWSAAYLNGEAVGEESNFHRFCAGRDALKVLRKVELSLNEALATCHVTSDTDV